MDYRTPIQKSPFNIFHSMIQPISIVVAHPSENSAMEGPAYLLTSLAALITATYTSMSYRKFFLVNTNLTLRKWNPKRFLKKFSFTQVCPTSVSVYLNFAAVESIWQIKGNLI